MSTTFFEQLFIFPREILYNKFCGIALLFSLLSYKKPHKKNVALYYTLLRSAPARRLPFSDDFRLEILSIPNDINHLVTQAPLIRHPWRERLQRHPCRRLLDISRDTRISRPLSYASWQSTDMYGAGDVHIQSIFLINILLFIPLEFCTNLW